MEPLTLISKYYSADSPEFATLVIHSILVTNKALKLANNYLNHFSNQIELDLNFIKEAGLLHDIGFTFPDFKGAEKNGFLTKIKKANFYLGHSYWGAELLRAEGLKKHALVAERHSGTGLKKEEIIKNGWPLPARDFISQTIEEKIISFADLFYSKSSATLFKKETSAEIIKELESYDNPEEKVAIFREWEKLFGKFF